MQRIDAIERILDLAARQDEDEKLLEALETIRDLAVEEIRQLRAVGHTERCVQDHEALSIFEDLIQELID